MKPSIYVSIPSLYDTELIPTVIGLFENAAFPERIVVGVSLLDDSTRLLKAFKKHTKKYSSQIRFKFDKITYDNVPEKLGVGYGRKQASDMYRDEDYMLQCDSHTYVDKDWDEKLIKLFKKAKRQLKLDKLVLTAYAGRYGFANGEIRMPVPGDESSRYPFYTSQRWLSEFIPSWKDTPIEGKGFIPATKFNANFAFGDKEFANNTGVFEPAGFFEEEPLQSILLRSAGFALVFPILKHSIVYHLYSTPVPTIGPGFRRSSSSYASPLQNTLLKHKIWTNWKGFVLNPENYDRVKDYEQYCGTSMRYGVIKENYIPKHY